MKTKGETEPIQQFLENALELFESRARRSAECVLSAPTRMAKPFAVSPVLLNTFSVSCIIQGRNSDYSTSLILGVNSPDLEDLLPSVDDMEMRLDAIGEVNNVLAGNLFGHPGFSSRFGSMQPSLPVFAHGGTTVKKAWCIQGILLVNAAKMFMGCAMEKAPKQ